MSWVTMRRSSSGPGERPSLRMVTVPFSRPAVRRPTSAPAQLDRLVELQHRAVGGVEHHRAAALLGSSCHALGHLHHAARVNFDLPVAQVAVFAQEQLDLAAFEDLRVSELPGAGRKQAFQLPDPPFQDGGAGLSRSSASFSQRGSAGGSINGTAASA